MRHHNLNSLSLLTALACAVMTVGLSATVQAQETKVDPTGVWTWSNPGRNGNPGSTNTLTLKATGATVTGTLKSPARGGKFSTTDISEGALNGAELTFNTTRTYGSNTITLKYSGHVSPDTIKGKISTERNGQARSRNWEAKRETGPAQSGPAQ